MHRYVYPSEIKTFGSVAARQNMLSTGPIGRSWAYNYTTAGRLPLHTSMGGPNTPYPPTHHILGFQAQKDGDVEDLGAYSRPYFDPQDPLSHSAISFVHGGLSATYSKLSPFPTRINEISAGFLRKLQDRVQPPPHPPNAYPGLPPSIFFYIHFNEAFAKVACNDSYNRGRGGALWFRWTPVVPWMGIG